MPICSAALNRHCRLKKQITNFSRILWLKKKMKYASIYTVTSLRFAFGASSFFFSHPFCTSSLFSYFFLVLRKRKERNISSVRIEKGMWRMGDGGVCGCVCRCIWSIPFSSEAGSKKLCCFCMKWNCILVYPPFSFHLILFNVYLLVNTSFSRQLSPPSLPPSLLRHTACLSYDGWESPVILSCRWGGNTICML